MDESAELRTAEQLKALAALDALFDHHGLDYWLFGGWAVDFWVGVVTRPHDDVDLTVWRDDYPEIRRLLELAGWRYEPVDDEAIGAGFRSGTVLVELTFVVSDAGGQVFIPFDGEPGLWSTGPFGEQRCELDGVTCRIVPRAFLLAGKAEPRDDEPDAAKDRADFAALSSSTPRPPPDSRRVTDGDRH